MGEDILLEDYTSDQAVTSCKLYNPGASKLAVVFPPWHGGGKTTQNLVSRLVGDGSAVLNCEFHDQIIEPNAERVPKSFASIQESVGSELQRLHECMGYRRIHLIGISLGNVAMTMVAEVFQDFSAATFLVAGSNLASAMWDGRRTQGIKEVLRSQGYTKAQLDEAWQDLAPKKYAPIFKDKDVQAIISKKDNLIPTSYQIEMGKELDRAGVLATKKYTNSGHAATIARFCLFSGKVYL